SRRAGADPGINSTIEDGNIVPRNVLPGNSACSFWTTISVTVSEIGLVKSPRRHPSLGNLNPFPNNQRSLHKQTLNRSRMVHSRLKSAACLLTLGLTLTAFPQTKAEDRITQAIDDRETAVLEGNLHGQLK